MKKVQERKMTIDSINAMYVMPGTQIMYRQPFFPGGLDLPEWIEADVISCYPTYVLCSRETPSGNNYTFCLQKSDLFDKSIVRVTACV